MKHLNKIAAISLAFAFLTTLCACRQSTSSVPPEIVSPSSDVTSSVHGSSEERDSEPAPSSSDITASSAPSSSNSTASQDYTFQVNASMPTYVCNANIIGEGDGSTQQIIISASSSSNIIQTITPPENNDVFTKSAVYFTDVNFDGDIDLLIPIERAAHYISFDAYIWDSAKQQFDETPSFQNILNPAIDAANRQILSVDYPNAYSTYYSIFTYQNGQFLQTTQFSLTPATNDTSSDSNATNLMLCTETIGDSKNLTVINSFFVSTIDDYGTIDENDPQIQPYFKNGLFWDLNNSKWDCTFANELKDFISSDASTAPSNLVTVQNAPEMSAYKAVLQNDANFYSTDISKEITLNNLQQAITPDNSVAMTIDQFAVIDLDNDSTPEIVLSLTMGGYYGSEVLHYQNGIVYGYTFSNRQFGDPKSDGTFYFSSGASDNGIGTILFDRENYSLDSITYCSTNTDGSSASYFVNRQSATEDEFNTAIKQWESKPDVMFYDFTQSNIDMIFSPSSSTGSTS